MNRSHIGKTSILKILTLTSTLLFASTNSLAEVTQDKKLHIQKGYPYEGLVNRSEQVKILYTEEGSSVNCHVEVSQKGQIWQGKERSISLKKFTQKPLRACIDREEAKKLLAKTF
jgi:hypothetical protein